MGFLWLSNQPIVPPQLGSCCNSEFAEYAGHIIDSADSVQVQFQVFPCEDAVALEQDNVILENWTQEGDQICSDGTAGSASFLFLNPAYDRYFQITLTIPTYVSGVLTMTVEGGQEFEIEAPGVYTFHSSAPPSGSVEINVTSPSFTGCFLGLISVVPLETRYTMVLFDSNGVGIHTFTDFDLNGNFLTFNADMSEVEDFEPGCYTFRLTDPCQNTCFQNFLLGQYFDDDSQWSNITGPPNWEVVIPGQFSIEAETNGVYIAYNINDLCLGSYQFSILVTQASPTERFWITLGSTFLEITEPGAYTGILTATSESTLQNNIIFTGTFTTESGGFISVEQFSLIRVPEETQTVQSSIPYQIIDDADVQKCFIEIGGCATGEALGFNFELEEDRVFSPFVRIHGAIEGAQYQIDAEVFQYKSGKRDTVYYDRRKNKEIRVDKAREYIHDFLSVALGFDNLYVNGFRVVPLESEYPELDWQNTNSFASVSIPIESQTQKIRKVRCSAPSNACEPISEEGEFKEFEDENGFVFQDGILYEFN